MSKTSPFPIQTSRPVVLFGLITLLVIGAAFTIHCGSGSDDDDEHDYGSADDDDGPVGGDDDDDQSDGQFECGEDKACHTSFYDCILNCDGWECIDQCDATYRDCLDPDGCVLPFLECKDGCDSDQSCIDVCAQQEASCFAAECDADEDCLIVCYDDWQDCNADCDAQIGCLLGCYVDYEGCFWDCLPV